MILVYTSIFCKTSGPCRIYIYTMCVYARESVMYYINIYIYVIYIYICDIYIYTCIQYTYIYIYIHTYIYIYHSSVGLT